MSDSSKSDGTSLPGAQIPLRPVGGDAEHLLRQVLETIPDAYITLDRNWRITYANPEAARANRMPVENFVGRCVWDVWPELVGTIVEQQYRKVLADGRTATFEHFSPVYDAWYELKVYATQEGLGVYYRDITARRRAERELRDSEQRYRVFTELNPQLILMADASGQVSYVNQRLLDYSGMTLEQTLGEGWRAAVHPEDELRVLQTWMTAVIQDDSFEVETRIRKGSDGSYRWFLVRSLPIRDEDSRTLYWLGICIDIHERKLAEEALKKLQAETERQRAELETLYQTAPIGLALFDPVEFRFLRLNDKEAEIVGLPPEQILGKTIMEITPIPGLLELFHQVAEGSPVKGQVLEGELPSQPGVHRHWAVNYSPVYAADGSVQAITAASLEITDQKRAEMALMQSEKLAAVGRLASSISHEINNPLEAVTNLLFLAASNAELPQEARDYIVAAQSELARVSQIAMQTLRFHRQAAYPTLVSPAELIDAVLNLYQGRLANSNIRVDARYATSTRVLCFENDIRQVLNNLIANAIDAMRSGGRLLTRAHNALDWATGRRGIRLTIADTGHGMSAEVKQRIFGAFFTTKDLNGTGLGLWISKGIVIRHQGRLNFRSSQKPGQTGTVFSIFLPLKETVHLPSKQ